jgi:hypothetical protein
VSITFELDGATIFLPSIPHVLFDPEHRIKTALCGYSASQLLAEIIQREDGQYQIGLCDDADGPFPSRAVAQAVAVKEARHLPQRGRQ